MIIQLENKISQQEKENILARIKEIGYKANEVTTQYGNYIVAIGKNNFDIRSIGHLAGVRDVHRVSDDYKLVSNKWKVNRSVIDLGDNIFIGEGNFAIMAGPCSIESISQIESIVNHLVENNIHILRGGAFKPRSSPYSFRGLGIDGLKMLYEKCKMKSRR